VGTFYAKFLSCPVSVFLSHHYHELQTSDHWYLYEKITGFRPILLRLVTVRSLLQIYVHRLNISEVLIPPNAKLLLMTYSVSKCLPSCIM
jgi:hypothetical protein